MWTLLLWYYGIRLNKSNCLKALKVNKWKWKFICLSGNLVKFLLLIQNNDREDRVCKKKVYINICLVNLWAILTYTWSPLVFTDWAKGTVYITRHTCLSIRKFSSRGFRRESSPIGIFMRYLINNFVELCEHLFILFQIWN